MGGVDTETKSLEKSSKTGVGLFGFFSRVYKWFNKSKPSEKKVERKKVEHDDKAYQAFIAEYASYCTPQVLDKMPDYTDCQKNIKKAPYYLVKLSKKETEKAQKAKELEKPKDSKWELFYVSDDFADEAKSIEYRYSVRDITEADLSVYATEEKEEEKIRQYVESKLSKLSKPLLMKYGNDFYTYHAFTETGNEPCVTKIVFDDLDQQDVERKMILVSKMQLALEMKKEKILISCQETPELISFFLTESDRKKLLIPVKINEVVNLDEIFTKDKKSTQDLTENDKRRITHKIIAHRTQGLGTNLSDFPSRLIEEGSIVDNNLGTIADTSVVLAENEADQDSALAKARDEQFLGHTQGEILTPVLSFLAMIEAFVLYQLLKNKNDAFKKSVNVWYRSFKTMSIVGYDIGYLIVQAIPFLPPGFSKILSVLVGTVTGLVIGLTTGLIYHFLSPSIERLSRKWDDWVKNSTFLGDHFPVYRYACAKGIEFTRLGREGWSKYGKAGLVLGASVGAALIPILGPLGPLIGGLCGFFLALALMPVINMFLVSRSAEYKAWLKSEKAPKKEYELTFVSEFTQDKLTSGNLCLMQDSQNLNLLKYKVLEYNGTEPFDGQLDITKLNIQLSDETLSKIARCIDGTSKFTKGKLNFTDIRLDTLDSKILALICNDADFKNSILKKTTRKGHTRHKDLVWRTNYLRAGMSIGSALGFLIGGSILFAAGGASLLTLGGVAAIAGICAVGVGLICHFGFPYLCRYIDPDNMLKSSVDYDLRASVFFGQYTFANLLTFCLDEVHQTKDAHQNDINKDLISGAVGVGMTLLTVGLLYLYYRGKGDNSLSAAEFKKKYQDFLPRSQRITSGIVVGIVFGTVLAGILCFIPGVGLSFPLLSLICVGVAALVFGLAAAIFSEKACEKMSKIEKKYVQKLSESEESEAKELDPAPEITVTTQEIQQEIKPDLEQSSLTKIQEKLGQKLSESEESESKKLDPAPEITVTTQKIQQETELHVEQNSCISQNSSCSENLKFTNNLPHSIFRKIPNRDIIDCEQSLLQTYNTI